MKRLCLILAFGVLLPAMARAEENIEALRRRLRAPLIADVPFGAPSDFPVALERLWPGRGSP